MRTTHLSERSSICDVAIGIKELCVIEHVENLGAEFKLHVLPQRYNFVNTQVQIRRAWAAADGARRIADLAQGSIDKR